MCKLCHIKCDVMALHPKAIAIFPNLKDGSFSTIKIFKNTFSFFHQDVSLKWSQFFYNSFCKRSFDIVPRLLIVNKTWVIWLLVK